MRRHWVIVALIPVGAVTTAAFARAARPAAPAPAHSPATFPAAVAATVAAAVVAQATPAIPAAPVDVRRDNRLMNPGFEGAFVLHGASELVVGEGWTPWYDGSLVRPEFKDEPYVRYKPDGEVYSFSLRVFHGRALQKFFTSSAAHDAGLSQRVAVPLGAHVRFGAFVMAWTSDCDDPCVSPLTRCSGSNNSNGEYRVQIGIDPTGAPPPSLGEPPSADVVWSPDVLSEAWDRWIRLGLDAHATGDAVTVYLRGRAKWAVKHNDSYWDEARLEVVAPTPAATGSPAASPTEPPTEPPTTVPTTVPTTAPTASPTTSPTETPPASVFLPRALNLPRPLSLTRSRGDDPNGPRDAVPSGANIVIDFPIRSHPGMANFGQPSCDELAFEHVLIRNAGSVTVRMAGWTLSNAAGDAYTFPPIRLDAGELVRVWTGVGPSVGYDGMRGGVNDVTDGHFTDLYWRREGPVWDNASDRATVRDDLGTIVAERGYP